MVYTGLSEAIGSCKIIEILLPRYSRISASLNCSRSTPSNLILPPTILPPGCGTSRSSDRLVMVLPEPDSPTMPSVSPGATVKLTPSTALTTPRRVKKYVRRSSTCSSGCTTLDLPQAGVQPVAQPVAQEVARQHHHADRQAGEERDPPGAIDQAA